MPGGMPPHKTKTNTFSIVAIVGGFVLPIVGIIFGILGLNHHADVGSMPDLWN